nr:hypothetical protein [Halomonas socia]
MPRITLSGLLLGIGLALAMAGTPAMADHDRRGYHGGVHHHYYGAQARGGKHHRAPRHAKRPKHHRRPVVVHRHAPRYRPAPPRRVEHHHYHRPSSSVPLVRLGNVPIVSVRVD